MTRTSTAVAGAEHRPATAGLATAERAAELRMASRDWPSWELTPRQVCDLELLLVGGFAPLKGFFGRGDYESVVERMRLRSGVLWPIPVVLDVPAAVVSSFGARECLALRDETGTLLAALHIRDVWRPDRRAEAALVYGTADPRHPGVAALTDIADWWCVGGEVEGIALPAHYDFRDLRATPRALRERFETHGWQNVVAFQCRNPMHRAHFELTLRAAREARAGLLVHPVVGMSKPGDIDHYTRVRCYRALMPRYPAGTATLALLPLAMRMAGPREALWHALIRRNYGCTHFIVGRDHAGPGADEMGRPYYDPYAAQQLVAEHADEIGIRMMPYREIAYVSDLDRYMPEDEIPDGALRASISGTELRRMLGAGEEPPAWFSPPEVIRELRRTHPPRTERGFTVLFTGLSGAGKSTIASALVSRLMEEGSRRTTLLDGDVVRKMLSSELGFSREHRDLNVRRIGFVAAEIARHGGAAVCAPIAPFAASRRAARAACESAGGFLLVYVRTPLEVCEERDPKGLYAKARAGTIPSFTGVSDPYEEPDDADIVVDTRVLTVDDAVEAILDRLRRDGYLAPAR